MKVHQLDTNGASDGDFLGYDPDVDEYRPMPPPSAGGITGLTSDDASVTITDNGDGTLDLAAAGGGGGGSTWTQQVNDGLSSLAGMKTALNGIWAITGGVLRQSSTAAAQTHISHDTNVVPSGLRVAEVEMAHVSSTGAIRRMGLIVSSSNVTAGNLVVYAQSANGTSWFIAAEDDAATAIWYTSATIAYAGSGYLRLGVIQMGSSFDVYLAGVWLGSFHANAFKGGPWVGLYTYACSADFRNLKAWKTLASPL